MYHESGLEFQTINSVERRILFENQLKFLEPFRS